MPARRVWLLACGATLLLNVWRLVARQGDAPEVAAACSLARQLELAPPPSETGSDAADDEVRLFWWHRFEGHRRAVRTPQKFTCADGLSCVSDSRTSAFAAAHGVVIWSGPDHRRGECLPPQRPAHTWVLEFSEPPTVDVRTEAELYSEAFAQRFEVKVSHELDSDVVLTALHPLVEGGVIPPDEWLHATAATPPPRMAISWLASYCPAPNRRDELVLRLQASLPPSVPLLSIGRCLNNHHEPLLAIKPSHGQMSRALYGSKLRALSRYAFCLVTENSAAADYVTEKLFHAFASGCLPIYYGTEDVARFLPTPKAALQVLAYPTLAALVSHLSHLAANRTAFVEHVAWRGDATLVSGWWEHMQALTHAAETGNKPALFCAICGAVRRARLARLHRGRAGSGPIKRLHASRRPRLPVWPPLLS